MFSNEPFLSLAGQGKERKLYSRVMQSPLSGVSDSIFRGLIRRWAPEALLFTEMVKSTGLKPKQRKVNIEDFIKDSGPLGVQIFDCYPEAMATAAQKAEEAGAFVIDINMGCPVKKIVSKGSGSGLLLEPLIAEKIVKAVVNAVSIPVTVKTRLGWCNKSSDPIGFGLRLEDAGAQLLTLHGRTRSQGFSGKSDWTAISTVKKRLNIPVIANGDINSVEDAFKCLEITQADGLMIGRASMGAPWLVGQIDAALRGKSLIKTPGSTEKLELAIEHLNSLLSIHGEHGLLIARKHINWTCKTLNEGYDFKAKIMSAKTSHEARNILLNQLKILSKNNSLHKPSGK